MTLGRLFEKQARGRGQKPCLARDSGKRTEENSVIRKCKARRERDKERKKKGKERRRAYDIAELGRVAWDSVE